MTGGLVVYRAQRNWRTGKFGQQSPSAVRDEPPHGRANENVKTLPNKITTQNIDKEAATGEGKEVTY
jgi:hypothetical protein